jgi:GNAT superfamily N-acetyltransferase
VRRFVFADADEAAARCAARIAEANVFLKVCAEEATVRALLPGGWVLRPPGFMMTLAGPMPAGAAPDSAGVTAISQAGPVIFCDLLTASGEAAARGRAVIVDNRVIYDRNAVAPDHRRRGLGGQVMRALESATGGPGRAVLVATEDGQALYRLLGWRLHSPYTTAVIPG